MQADIHEVLIDRTAIAKRLDELAKQLLDDHLAEYKDDPDNAPGLTLVPILTGAMIFASDLIRRLPVRMQIRVMSITSYAGATTTSRGASVEAALTRLPDSLEGLNVVLIDDILDTGTTLKRASEILAERNPAKLSTCVLLRKKRDEPPVIEADYVAFEVPDEFVVGYGLDYDDYYRNLPDIVVLKPEVFGGVPHESDPAAAESDAAGASAP